MVGSKICKRGGKTMNQGINKENLDLKLKFFHGQLKMIQMSKKTSDTMSKKYNTYLQRLPIKERKEKNIEAQMKLKEAEVKRKKAEMQIIQAINSLNQAELQYLYSNTSSEELQTMIKRNANKRLIPLR